MDPFYVKKRSQPEFWVQGQILPRASSSRPIRRILLTFYYWRGKKPLLLNSRTSQKRKTRVRSPHVDIFWSMGLGDKFRVMASFLSLLLFLLSTLENIYAQDPEIMIGLGKEEEVKELGWYQVWDRGVREKRDIKTEGVATNLRDPHRVFPLETPTTSRKNLKGELRLLHFLCGWEMIRSDAKNISMSRSSPNHFEIGIGVCWESLGDWTLHIFWVSEGWAWLGWVALGPFCFH